MKKKIEIKICGINDFNSMVQAVNSEVDYIGFVFYEKSPRNITLSKAKTLASLKSNKSKIVALTVDANDNFLNEIKSQVCPDFFQVHGLETPERCNEIRSIFKIPIIKGLGIKDKKELKISTKKYEDKCDILILDAPSNDLPGGNGKKFDWEILKNYKPKTKWMLAGGLNIYNIKEAINFVTPPGVDVSSGVERVLGKKDAKLIKNFVENCKQYNG